MTDVAAPFLPFARPSITDRERAAVLEVLDSGWLTTGPKTKAFEAAFAERVGARHAIALNSATAALHLALEAFGVDEGDEVIVPTWTFAASAEVVAYRRGKVVLVDVERETLNATTESVLAAVTPRTKAVIAVHIAGRPMAIEELVGELDARGIPVVEDSAHAFPSRIGGPGGPMAGHGGPRRRLLVLRDQDHHAPARAACSSPTTTRIADRVRLMSLHGISRDAWKRYTAGGSWYYEIEDAGYKYNMTDIAAALGLVQLDRAEELLERAPGARRAVPPGVRRVGVGRPARAAERRRRTARTPGTCSSSGCSSTGCASTAPPSSTGWPRPASGRASTSSRSTCTRTTAAWAAGRAEAFPVAEREYPRVISLPLWPGMTPDDIGRVVDALDGILAAARR